MSERPDYHGLSVEQGFERMLELLEPGPITRERVPLEAAVGRVLAEAPRSRWPLPTAATSIMDGYALRSEDLIRARRLEAETLALELAGESSAGHPSSLELEPGSCLRIATGAVVPAGADAVVPQEDTRLIELGARTLVEFNAAALKQAAPGRWVRPAGSDVGDDELLLEPGTVLSSGCVSLLAAAGHAQLELAARPRVAILSSGDELLRIGETPGPGQIVGTNAMMLAAEIRAAGGEPLELGAVADTHEAMRGAIARAMSEADLLVCSGGISVGDHDLVLPSLQHFGFELGFRKLSLRPGRPTTFGHLPRADSARKLPVLALPGNPASTLVTFELFARTAIRVLLGLPRRRWRRPWRQIELAAPVRGEATRTHFVRARFEPDGRVSPLDKQQSGALRSIASFELLVRVPAGQTQVAAGERLDALILRE